MTSADWVSSDDQKRSTRSDHQRQGDESKRRWLTIVERRVLVKLLIRGSRYLLGREEDVGTRDAVIGDDE